MSQCLTPIHIRDEAGKVRVVPCGRCAACLVRSRQEWVYRLREEDRVSAASYFITLTYDDEHLPIREFPDENGEVFYESVVSKEDAQKFNKRFRKRLSALGVKVRYYFISEYGSEYFSRRPHYHAIYFLDTFLDSDTVLSVARDSWPMCDPLRVTCDPVTEGRLKYVTTYCLNRKDIPDYLTPNFRFMSNRPGLGASYIPRMTEWHLADNSRFIAPGYTGDRCNLPRYYRDKIYSKEVRSERASQLESQHRLEELRLEHEHLGDAAFWTKYERDKSEFIRDYTNHVKKFVKDKSKKNL